MRRAVVESPPGDPSWLTLLRPQHRMPPVETPQPKCWPIPRTFRASGAPLPPVIDRGVAWAPVGPPQTKAFEQLPQHAVDIAVLAQE